MGQGTGATGLKSPSCPLSPTHTARENARIAEDAPEAATLDLSLTELGVRSIMSAEDTIMAKFKTW